jgi:hypothetical protein
MVQFLDQEYMTMQKICGLKNQKSQKVSQQIKRHILTN